MPNWTEIYRDKDRKREAWACKGCETVVNSPHKHGAPNHICHCDAKINNIGSKEYRNNFDLIKWNKDAKT